MTTRIVELRRGILKKNDELAAGLRRQYTDAGVLVLNLVSSPGTGKTAFLERTLRELRERGSRVAALVGDLETDNDARRLAASGAPVRQINTHGICHLDAEMISKHLDGWELALKNINEIRPGIRIFETSAKTGAGMEEWLGYLQDERVKREAFQ